MIARCAALLILLVGGLASWATAQGLSVVSGVEPDRAPLGRPIRYSVQLQGIDVAALEKALKDGRIACATPSVDGLRFEPTAQGATNQVLRQVIVNGRLSRTETADYQFDFAVTVERPGRYTIPAPVVTFGGKDYTGRPTRLVITDPRDESRALLEARCDPPRVALGQKAELIVDVFLEKLPSALRADDPLDPYDKGTGFFDRGTEPPVLTLPWLAEPPQGLGSTDREGWLRARVVPRGGFRLAGWRGRFLERAHVTDVRRDDPRGRERHYRRYRFTFPIRGEVAGHYTLPPARLEGAVVGRVGNRYRFENIFVSSEPLELEVMEPPLEGRPDSFRGAVGTFTFEMEPPTPTTVRVGDPVYVTLVVKGEGFLKGVTLDLQGMLGDDFRVERVGVTDSLPPGAERPPGFPSRPGQWRQWDFKVFPIAPTVTALPPVEFSWYDPGREAYVTATTDPVPLTVRDAAAGAEGVVVGDGARAGAREDVELVPTEALSANVTDLNLMADQTPRLWPYLAALAGMLVGYLGLAFVVRHRRRLAADPALVRRRRAPGRALERLRAARRQSGAEAVRTAHMALAGYVADLSDRDEEALTGDDLLRWLGDHGADDAALDQVRALEDAVEAIAFGGGAVTGEQLGDIVTGLERIVRQRPGTARTGLWLVVALALGGSAAAQDPAQFNEARAAYEAGAFERAAKLYEQILAGGYENGYVLYNLGNCRLRAGNLGAAIAAYRRARLYLPADANLEVNLRRALDARTMPLSPPDERTILDHVLFWRPRLAFASEARLTVLAAGIAFLLAVVRLLVGGNQPLLKGAIALALLASALLGASAALDYVELRAHDHGVITADSTPLRTGPGDSYEPAYEQTLREGVEFTVLARRDDWLKVRAGTEYVGWLDGSAAMLW